MEKDFWLSKWEMNQIGFHQDEYNPNLMEYLPHYLTDHHSKPNVLVPLCGKTKDIIYLANHAQKIIGVELAEKACHDFFIENALQFDVQEINENVKVYRSLNIELYCGDIFNIDENVFKDIDLIYDRASLVALPQEMRTKLYQLYKKLLKNDTRLYAITFEYDQSQMQGPPFSISTNEFEEEFKNFHLKHLSSSKTNFGENKIDFHHHTYEVR